MGIVTRVSEGRVLLNAARIPPLSTKAYDSRSVEIGYVSNVMGPESSPYIVVKLNSEVRPEVGDKLYVEDRV